MFSLPIHFSKSGYSLSLSVSLSCLKFGEGMTVDQRWRIIFHVGHKREPYFSKSVLE